MVIDQTEYFLGCLNTALRKVNELNAFVIKTKIDRILGRNIGTYTLDSEVRETIKVIVRLNEWLNEVVLTLTCLRDGSVKYIDCNLMFDYQVMVFDYLMDVKLKELRLGSQWTNENLAISVVRQVKMLLKRCYHDLFRN